MPRAAPGDIARRAMRRNLLEDLGVPVRYSDRRLSSCTYPLGMESFLHPFISRCNKWCYFTLHFSFFRVERGRLGEVVSLVGDCRPPPPGNPRQPTTRMDTNWGCSGKHPSKACAGTGSIIFPLNRKNNGGVLLTVRKQYSFNNHQITTNLKKLNNQQYFKNNRSYYYCTCLKPVLEFEHFHSHLCGFREVEPPSIAITNVLGT